MIAPPIAPFPGLIASPPAWPKPCPVWPEQPGWSPGRLPAWPRVPKTLQVGVPATYIRVYICIQCIYIYTHAYVHVCMHVCIHVYI